MYFYKLLNAEKNMFLKLSTQKYAGVGAQTTARVVFKEKREGYTTESFVMFQDFSTTIQASVVRAARVTDKTLTQSMELAKGVLPTIIQQVQTHYPEVTIEG